MDHCLITAGEAGCPSAAPADLARRAATRLLLRRLGGPDFPGRFTIVTRDGLGRRIRPQVFDRHRAVPLDVSLSHVAGLGAAATGDAAEAQVGVDLVRIAEIDADGLRPWLTVSERDLCRAADPAEAARMLATVWAGKEAAYKALHRGEAFDPLRTEVTRLACGTWAGRLRDRRCRLRAIDLEGCVCVLAGWRPDRGTVA